MCNSMPDKVPGLILVSMHDSMAEKHAILVPLGLLRVPYV